MGKNYIWRKLPFTSLLIIILILSLVIVLQLFFGDKINYENAESGIFTAISIMVALYAALFIWTALKEEDFKSYNDKYEELSDKIENQNKLIKVNYKLFQLDKKFLDDPSDFENFKKDIFDAYDQNLIHYKEIIRFSKIFWQQDEIEKAYQIRKALYEKDKFLGTSFYLCSIINFIDYDNCELRHDILEIHTYFDILLEFKDDIKSEKDITIEKIWSQAGKRLLRSAHEKDEYLVLALFCFYKAYSYSRMPQNRFYFRMVILISICIDSFEIDPNLEIVKKLDNQRFPSLIMNNDEIKQYVYYQIKSSLKGDSKGKTGFDTLVKKFFYKKRTIILDSINNADLKYSYRAIFSFLDDFFNMKHEKIYCNKLKENFTQDKLIKFIARKNINRPSIHNIYRLLESRYKKDDFWENLRIEYLTLYFIISADDAGADKILDEVEIKNIFNYIN